MRTVLAETGTPGMFGAAVDGEGVVWQEALGVADREPGRPVTHETFLPVGSMSKTFPPLAVLRLVERGELRLDDPVDGLVPGIDIANPWVDTEPVRLAHLLEHAAGLPDLGFRGTPLATHR